MGSCCEKQLNCVSVKVDAYVVRCNNDECNNNKLIPKTMKLYLKYDYYLELIYTLLLWD